MALNKTITTPSMYENDTYITFWRLQLVFTHLSYTAQSLMVDNLLENNGIIKKKNYGNVFGIECHLQR